MPTDAVLHTSIAHRSDFSTACSRVVDDEAARLSAGRGDRGEILTDNPLEHALGRFGFADDERQQLASPAIDHFWATSPDIQIYEVLSGSTAGAITRRVKTTVHERTGPLRSAKQLTQESGNHESPSARAERKIETANSVATR